MCFALFFILNCITINAEDDIIADITIIDQPAQFENGTPKIIAGLWHTITFEGLNEVDNELILTAYNGETLPTDFNETNYYQWKYTPMIVNPWQNTGESYANNTINPKRCAVNSEMIKFCVGIPDYLPNEIFYKQIWTIELSTTDKLLYQNNFYLEKPTRGFAKSHGDRLSFYVDPFTEMNAQASDYLILKNTGNVPLNITIDFEMMDSLLTYKEQSNQIPAYNQQNYKLELNSQSWKPQRIQQKGSASAVVADYYLLDKEVSGTAVSLQTALVIDVPTINIFVGHKNYELTTLDSSTGFSFQYQRSLSMAEGEIETINSYLSGEGTAKVSIQTNNNISVLNLHRNNKPANSPFTIISTNTVEQIISIKLKALSENRDGLITYTIETDDSVKTFTTRIDVGPPLTTEQPTGIGATSPVTIVVLLALILAAGYMLYNHLVHGRSERR